MSVRRREIIRIPAQALGGLLADTLAGEPARLPAQQPAEDTVELEPRHFTAAQARVVQAACARIFPSDENGPGATETGAVIYIDRYLKRPGLVA